MRLLAQQVAQLSATLGMVNWMLTKLTDDPEIAARATEINKGLSKLHTEIARLADAFPPPGEDRGIA